MLQLLLNTCLLALVQAIIPNHWLPLVGLAKSENWTRHRFELMASICASAHVLGTSILGISFGLSGTKLSHTYETYLHVMAPVVLILFGIVYFVAAVRSGYKDSSYEQEIGMRKAWVVSIILMMLLSPCLEVHDLFIAAADHGFDIILLLALCYAIVSVLGVLVITILAGKLTHKFYARFGDIERKKITAILLLVVGVASFFIH